MGVSTPGKICSQRLWAAACYIVNNLVSQTVAEFGPLRVSSMRWSCLKMVSADLKSQFSEAGVEEFQTSVMC